MISVGLYPNSRTCPVYFDPFYAAVGKHGIRIGIDGVAISDAELRAQASSIDALHINWPETIWRQRGTSLAGRLRGVLGFVRYLRLARSLGLQVWYTLHNHEPHERVSAVDRLGYALLLRCSDLVIVQSETSYRHVVGGRPAWRDKVALVPLGAPAGLFPSPRPRDFVSQELGVPDDATVLLCMGILRRYKGFDLAAEAMRLLDDRFWLVLAGPVMMTDAELTELKHSLGGVDRVVVRLERVSDQAVADLHHRADCCLLPYREVTTSAALLTALSFGRGVVATDLAYFREVVSQEPEAGVLFRQSSAPELASAVDRYVSQPSERRGAAAARLAARYSWAEVIQPLVGHPAVEAARGRRHDALQGVRG